VLRNKAATSVLRYQLLSQFIKRWLTHDLAQILKGWYSTHTLQTHLCRWCQDCVIKLSLANACPLALQPKEQNTNTCLLYFSVMRLKCASQLSVGCSGDYVDVVFAVDKHPWQLVYAGPCKCAAAATKVLTGEVQFSPRPGRDRCPLGPTRGQGCKTCPESHAVQQNTWKHSPQVLQEDRVVNFNRERS